MSKESHQQKTPSLSVTWLGRTIVCSYLIEKLTDQLNDIQLRFAFVTSAGKDPILLVIYKDIDEYTPGRNLLLAICAPIHLLNDPT